MITELVLTKAIGRFSLMKFFPSGDDDFRAGLMELLGEMCWDDEQINWLSRRVANLYPEWPGIGEVRAVFCSKYKPKDGAEVDSCVYVDGIPSERDSLPALPAGKPMLALPEGAVASVDAESEHLVIELGESATMPPALAVRNLGPHGQRVDTELKRLMHELPDPPPAPVVQFITAEQVDLARRLEMERRRKRQEEVASV